MRMIFVSWPNDVRHRRAPRYVARHPNPLALE